MRGAYVPQLRGRPDAAGVVHDDHRRMSTALLTRRTYAETSDSSSTCGRRIDRVAPQRARTGEQSVFAACALGEQQQDEREAEHDWGGPKHP
jgi:hypothetical protein